MIHSIGRLRINMRIK